VKIDTFSHHLKKHFMKKFILTLLLPLLWTISFAQNKVEAEKIVDEGIVFHDKAEYDNAIAKYDKALELDKDNLYALTEKAYSLLAQKKYEECIKVCERTLAKHKTGNELQTLYVTYGNALDMMGKSVESIAAYDAGIKSFPTYQMLYFNKAVTLRSLKKNEEALLALQKATLLNPNHPGSHNAMAITLREQNNAIGALLAYWRFFTLEPQGSRAESIVGRVQELMKANVAANGDKNVNISIPSGLLVDSKKGEKPKENTFGTTFLMLSMAAALDYGADFKNETDVQRFNRKFDIVCAALATSKKENYGFLWDYYVPYFLELKEKGYSEMFAHVAFAALGKPEITKYFQDNKTKLNEFSLWSSNYKWPAK
jgi:tetratricopeptide (TPR) repeat protein